MSSNIILQGIDADELVNAIAAAVLQKLAPLLKQNATAAASPPEIASREDMAKVLGWSVAKLDRRTREGLPSFMDGGRRGYVVSEVIDFLRSQTPAAEEAARKRQAKKHEAKNGI